MKNTFEIPKSFSLEFCSWFTGTDCYQIKHPKYGGLKLTTNQIKYSSGEFNNKLFKNIVSAIKTEIEIVGIDNALTRKLKL